MSPITGPRYKCKLCEDFDICDSCFRSLKTHRHPFMRFTEPGEVLEGKAGVVSSVLLLGGWTGGLKHCTLQRITLTNLLDNSYVG